LKEALLLTDNWLWAKSTARQRYQFLFVIQLWIFVYLI